MEKKTTRNIYLDLVKLFLSFLVVCIHVSDKAYSFFPVYRLAVPMFFIISGYFNYSTDSEKLKKKAFIFIKRTLRYLLIGFIIYIIFDFILCFIEGNDAGSYFISLFYENFIINFFVLNNPITNYGAHLWFLIALFVISLIHYFLVRFNKLNYYKIIIPVGYVFYFFIGGFLHQIQQTAIPTIYVRNALFFGLPNFALGYTLAKFNFHKKDFYKYIYLIIGIACFFLQIVEYKLFETPTFKLEMFISGIICAICILQFCLGIKNANCNFFYRWIGKNASFYIYILHMLVEVSFRKLFDFPANVTRYVLVFLTSFALYEITYLSIKLVKFIRAKIQDKKLPLTASNKEN